MRVRFPNGVEVAAVPLAERRADNPDRDVGLYMDPEWAPTWEAELIAWEDFGVPTDPDAATRQITAAYRRAADLIAIGAYKEGSDPEVDKAILLRPKIDALLQQEIDQTVSFEDTVKTLCELAEEAG